MLDPAQISEARLRRGPRSATMFSQRKADTAKQEPYNALWVVWGCDSTFMVGPYAVLLYDLTTAHPSGAPKVYVEGMTHEVTVHEIYPAAALPAVLGDPPWDPLPLVFPPCHVYQLKAMGDRLACEMIHAVVRDIERLDIYADRGSTVAAEQWDGRYKWHFVDPLKTISENRSKLRGVAA